MDTDSTKSIFRHFPKGCQRILLGGKACPLAGSFHHGHLMVSLQGCKEAAHTIPEDVTCRQELSRESVLAIWKRCWHEAAEMSPKADGL